MRGRLLLVGLVLLMAAPLMLVLKDFARDVILVPILRILWTGQLIFNSLPQLLLWAVLIAASLGIAGVSLMRRKTSVPEAPQAEVVRFGQIQDLTRRILLAGRGDYFRWSFSQYLGGLILEILADRERTTPERIDQRLREGTLYAPPEVLAYLRTRLTPTFSRPAGLFGALRIRLRSRVRTFSLDPKLERVVQFLEDQLDVRHDH